MKTIVTETLAVDASAFLAIDHPQRIERSLNISLTDRSYLPRTDDLQADWVASVAAPAFRALARQRGADAVRAFCSIGTGSGLDALTAIEILGATSIGVTDLFAEVVGAARDNIARNHLPDHPVEIHAGHGDLLEPLRGQGLLFDLIYENLPNLPMADAARLEIERTSSGYVPPRSEEVPAFVKDHLLVLHYLALRQARDFLAPGGTVLSTLGGRVPLGAMTAMAEQAGYSASFLTYGWKVQVDPEDMIGAYAAWEKQGLGPFTFYHADLLEQTFAALDPVAAGRQAIEIEQALAPRRLDARAAFAALKSGARIGHTVAVLKSDPR